MNHLIRNFTLAVVLLATLASCKETVKSADVTIVNGSEYVINRLYVDSGTGPAATNVTLANKLSPGSATSVTIPDCSKGYTLEVWYGPLLDSYTASQDPPACDSTTQLTLR
jgi:hypothetical protein